MKYYKLIRGYSAEDFIGIDETELEKATYCFLEKKDAAYSGGSVRGSEIIAIQPDYHRTMGWNRGYKLGPEDFAELSAKGVDKACQHALSEAREKVLFLMHTKQIHLLGKPVPGFESKELRSGAGVKTVAELMDRQLRRERHMPLSGMQRSPDRNCAF